MKGTAVVDTDVISFMFKGHSRAIDYDSKLQGLQIVLSFMTIAELRRWALKKNWGQQRCAELEKVIEKSEVTFADMSLCAKWAEVMMDAEWMGKPISAQDAWIAATALQANLPLITNNSKDFKHIPRLKVITIG